MADDPTNQPPRYPEGGEPTPGDPPPPYGGQPPPPPYGGAQPSPPPYPGQPPAYPTGPPAYGNPPPNYPGGPPAYGSPPPSYPGGSPAYGTPPPPPSYPGGYGGNYGEMQGKTGVSGLAIAALATGILLPLIGLLIAVPLAIVALVKISRGRQTGKWLAIFGIVAAVLWWVAFIILIVFVATDTAERDSTGAINKEGRIDFGDIRVGDCVSVPDLDSAADIDPFDLRGTPCTASHNAEASAILPVSGSSYPGTDALASEAAKCPSPSAYAGDAAAADLQVFYLYPTEELWDDDDGHRVVCFVIRKDFADTNAPLGQ